MSFELDELTGNESPEEIEALLDRIEADELEIDNDADVSNGQSATGKPTADNSEVSAASQDEPETSEIAVQSGIAAKDGEHIIFDVLERERETNKQLQQQLDEFKSRESQWSDDQRLLELRNQQLESLGVDPADLPENFNVTEEQLNELAEDYPEIGKMIRHLYARVDQFESRQPHEPAPPSNPVADAIEENSDLRAWQQEGGAQWNKALDIDDELRADPNWSQRPLNERFAEVARRVKDQKQSEAKAQQETAEAQDPSDDLPASPSEVGQTTTHQLSPKDRLATADETDIQSMFSGMTDAQIEALLSEFDT
ncbi:hypothetical protein [Vibrio sp. MEBiC08052]|uniref:hypothetical protein n=1 Tax=Vibrio sp. MEBiC08052 TaxID=1761910 RepID=UPI000740841D|nr:hypothetical protein [Vibrio sp. MEBiC08052]KUI98948.1 hypothetical protein VRK_19490 [Vibrio sp. MEBiC08052]